MRNILSRIFNRRIMLFALHYVAACYAFSLVLYLLERYFNLFHKDMIGWVMLGLLIVLARVREYKLPPARMTFLILASLIALRYTFWRTFSTLVYTDLPSMIGTIVLYAAEMYLVGTHFLGIFVGLWPLERDAAPPEDTGHLPTVDVFIPTYNEPLEMVKLTATAAAQIDYPADKLKIYILDDGATAAKRQGPGAGEAERRRAGMSALAADLGISYIAREKNEHAKAGNVNYALGLTGGDLVLLLDSDHVPTRDILSNTVGFFQRDPRLGLVQTPHFMGNPSIIEKNIGSFSNSPRENDMFFNMIHRSLDLWNASYFCGSAAILRRSALEEIGGFATTSITEDVQTSMLLHQRGYNSVYFRKPMVCGLQPNTFTAYVIQRMRWAQGMVQIFMLNNPLTRKGLDLFQKLCYLNACYFWFFSFSRLVMYFGPILFLTFGLKIYHASSAQVLSYTLPHVIAIFVVMYFFYGNTRRLFFSEVYESAQMMFMAPAVLSTLLNPRRPVFKITPKEMGVEKDELNLTGAMPFFVVVLANAAALPFAVYKWIYFPAYRDVILIGNFWCLYNMFIAIMTLGAFFERRESRRNTRFSIHGKAALRLPGSGVSAEAALVDGSLHGLGLSLETELSGGAGRAEGVLVGERAEVTVSDSAGKKYVFSGSIVNTVLRRGRRLCGVEFDHTERSYADAVSFLYGDSSRWTEMLRTRSTGEMFNVSSDVYYFLKRGLHGMLVCLVAALRWGLERSGSLLGISAAGIRRRLAPGWKIYRWKNAREVI